MPHFLITQRHDEDGSLEQELFESDTWQVALGMAQLGWALENAPTLSLVLTALRLEGYTVLIKQVESYKDYKGATKIQLKEVV